MRIITLSLCFALAASPALAAEFTLGLELEGDVQTITANYDCGSETPLTVTYLNAAPNFLAIVPVKGEDLIFVNTIAASGAKYEAGQYIWWNKGADATLTDVTEGLDAAPMLTCHERIETP
jgi:membrane-bound inhibitor of C-type lysozyme